MTARTAPAVPVNTVKLPKGWAAWRLGEGEAWLVVDPSGAIELDAPPSADFDCLVAIAAAYRCGRFDGQEAPR